MQSELHERLEYLVNYSSQLIFVSGDSAAQQKKTLESFVFQQHDETEIAYVTADSVMELADYRRQLCRQLLGTLVGSYTRPLNELLAGLNEHVGPILITITQAEHIPDPLLQELWDLVLQSRFAGNKQHLNVLLFGESSWAERAKKWLPAKNTDTPLLISSQSVATQQPGSELDKMIENRRKAFHEHVAKRDGYDEYMETKSTNILKSPLFITLVLLLFLSIFIAIVYWQYKDDIDALFSPIDQNLTPYVNSVEPGSAFSELEQKAAANTAEQPVVSWDDAVASMDDDTNAQNNEASAEDLLSFIEEVSTDKPAEPVQPSTNPASQPSPESSGNDEDQTQLNARMDVPPKPQETTAETTPKSMLSSVPREPMAASGFDERVTGRPAPTKPDVAPPSRPQPEPAREPFTASQIDSASVEQQADTPQTAPDIARFEANTELPPEEPVQQGIQTAQTLPQRPQTVALSESEEVTARADPRLPQPVIQTRAQTIEAIAASSPNYDNWELINNIPPEDYVIQLAGLKDEALMLEFIEDNNMQDFIWIYRTNRYGGNWFVVLFNNSYDTFGEANAAINDIPAFQGSEKIFIKQGNSVVEEIEKVFP